MCQSELGSLWCNVEEGSVVWEADVEGHESREPAGTGQLASCVLCGGEALSAELGMGDCGWCSSWSEWSWVGSIIGPKDGKGWTCSMELGSFMEDEKKGVSSKKVTSADM